MSNSIKIPELMAPAGNRIHLTAAINAGADAVYFGASQFNMRARARNFRDDDLTHIVQTCHQANVKAYLTVNTIVYEKELDELKTLLTMARDAGVDQVIAWDWGVLSLCRELNVPFAISTQGSLSNSAAIDLAKTLGARRVVLARECSLEDLKLIRQKTDLEIEVFVHGAMCVAVSGRCLMSQELYGHSANRGDCIQPCRRKWEITARDPETNDVLILGEDSVLSPKDLCSLPFLNQLVETGIDSIKIEGRKRSPEYVSVVTRVYRDALDSIAAGTWNRKQVEHGMLLLSSVFNRGFSTGFYHTDPGLNEWSDGPSNQSDWHKEYIGKLISVDAAGKTGVLKVEARPVHSGDQVVMNSEVNGVEFFEAELVDSESAVQGETVRINLPKPWQPGDQIYAWVLEPVTQG